MAEAVNVALLSFDSNVSDLREFVGALNSTCLKTSAEAFCGNIESILALLLLPGNIALLSHTVATHTERHFRLLDAAGFPTNPRILEILRHATHGGIDRDLGTDEAYRQQLEGMASLIQPFVDESDVLQGANRALLSAATIAAWTAFECLAGDAWEETVSITREIPLGRILRSRIDFTGVDGISRAYKSSFATSDSLAHYLSKNQPLKKLEATRHLLVHRAGVVDDKYIARTQSTEQVGAPLFLSVSGVCFAAQVAIEAGRAILSFLEERLEKPV